MKRNTLWKRAASTAAICALSLVFVPGCSDDDSLGEQVEEVGDEVGDEVEDAADEVKDAAEDAADEAEDTIDGQG